jgi:hypothetical protein
MASEPSTTRLLRKLGLSAAQLAGIDALSSAEFTALDGVTAGTVAASKALIVDANKDLASLRHLTLTGNLVTGATTLSETDLAKIDAITNGTVAASKAAVVDANLDISGFRHLTITGNLVTGATTLSEADLAKIDGITNGTAAASKAIVLDSSLDSTGARNVTLTGAIDSASHKIDAVTMSALKWVDVTVTAALLDAAGTVPVIAGVVGDQYKIRNIRLVGGGTNFAAGGDRLIDLTDGTTVWTTIANADIESAPTATLDWGNAKVPYLTGTSDTASASNAAIRFQYSGGTTDHSATGSIKFSVCLEKVA